jgi:glyoxylase-like metal-dependent hydrolase (beta-lactamase superfamily II)
MFFKHLPNGLLDSNVYIISDRNDGIIIDAGVETSYIEKIVMKNDFKISKIILTHGHIDHICYVNEIAELFSAEVFIHKDDFEMLYDNKKNCSSLLNINFKLKTKPTVLEEGDIISLGDMDFSIISTPGHSKGSICIKMMDMIFSGDTLFRESIGRTDLFGGNQRELENSILNKLYTFDPETIIYPGHGGSTQIKHERIENPYVRIIKK